MARAKPHHYSEEEIEFIRSNASSMGHKEFAEYFNRTFNTNIYFKSLANYARRHGLISRLLEEHRYTEEEKNFLRENIKGRTYEALASIFNEHFGHSFTAQHISSYCHSIGIYNDGFGRGKNYSQEELEYIYAHADQCDSYTAEDLERIFGTNRTLRAVGKKRRDKGIHCPHRNRTDWCSLPIGYERRRSNKVPYVKVSSVVASDNNWVPKDRLVWEEHTGCPVPKDYVLHHMDLDPMNCSIENLMIIPKKYCAFFMSNDWWSAPPEIKKVAVRWCDYHFELKKFEDKEINNENT